MFQVDGNITAIAETNRWDESLSQPAPCSESVLVSKARTLKKKYERMFSNWLTWPVMPVIKAILLLSVFPSAIFNLTLRNSRNYALIENFRKDHPCMRRGQPLFPWERVALTFAALFAWHEDNVTPRVHHWDKAAMNVENFKAI